VDAARVGDCEESSYFVPSEKRGGSRCELQILFKPMHPLTHTHTHTHTLTDTHIFLLSPTPHIPLFCVKSVVLSETLRNCLLAHSVFIVVWHNSHLFSCSLSRATHLSDMELCVCVCVCV